MGRSASGVLLIVLAYIGFVSLGLPDAVIGVAWPGVRDAFGLPQGAVGLVSVASGTGYFVSSFFSGPLARRLGIGLLLAGSTAMAAAAGFGYAFAPVWVLFLAAGVVHGLGSGAIDGGLNGFAAHHLSARHMNWLHACYCFGAMLGPLLMTWVLTAGRTYPLGYSVVGFALLALAGMFTATRSQWGEAVADAGAGGPVVSVGAALRVPAVWLQMAVFFVYVGLEVTVGQWAFTVLTESRGVRIDAAGNWSSVYWGSLGVGRVLFGWAVERVGIDRLVRASLLVAVGGAVLFASGSPVGLVLIGFGFAPVFPCLMTRTPERLGPAVSAHAIGFQVGAAMIGGAVVPWCVGLAVDRYGLEAMPRAVIGLVAGLLVLHEVLMRWTPGATPARPAESAADSDFGG